MNQRSSDRTRLQQTAVVVLIALVAPFVVYGVPQVVGADHSYVVQSDSMSPAIGAGSVVYVTDAGPETLSEGEVITYRTAGGGESGRVTHRIVEVVDRDGTRAFRTKGDANEDPDPQLVDPNQVVGRVAFHVPLVGYVVAFAGTDLGLALLVVVPAVLLVASELWDLYRGVGDAQADEGQPETEPEEPGETG